jgi:hypothetical protein
MVSFWQKPIFWLFLLALFCLVLYGCADGLVLEPVPAFDQPSLTIPIHEPSALPSPVTPFEIAQSKLKEGEQYLPLLGPLVLVFFIVGFFFRFLRLIYELSTTAPD